ncbi:cation diffusion facilitator family transporter [Candidatus Parcubacteria bacterium]|nr:cation diffusion facilitator family transporter [Patescibacteria group bacterium]MBU4309639.1 cation diffusion facilitator family transporter [Patescibacteria group bacterium]MBU4432720.1 cation diffusion facilitator family transporter [Patescibacteria group bacterium]MBU4577973.1 cation diffusion facilitator family transporter [Patescibacteria group bacterium]MCG2696518.1 cation diffusion facilitator family transporter [Candidatus Parcubacteria bacterium]
MSNQRTTGLTSVALAFLGNLFIAFMKLIAFFVSGSSVMFSEAIHSFADTANQGLLMVGIKRSMKKADAYFDYGYGQERFLWALISACGIFFLGAGVTIYNGIESLRGENSIFLNKYVFIILGLSLIIETFTLLVAVREIKKNSNGRKFFKALEVADPTTLAVLYEDSVAVLGILVASLSMVLTMITGQHYWDAAGSIVVGLLLGFIAVVLIKKNMELLKSRSIPEEAKERLIEILESEPAIERVIDLKSSILNVGVYRVICEVEFNGPSLLRELYKNNEMREEYDDIKEDYQEFIRFCADYADRIPRLIGSKINKIEEEIQREIPEIRHIDIELN